MHSLAQPCPEIANTQPDKYLLLTLAPNRQTREERAPGKDTLIAGEPPPLDSVGSMTAVCAIREHSQFEPLSISLAAPR